ncbi:zeta toxin family protein [Taibaiella chishuiensis]|uniref:Putative ABC-type ATPase n=2 Tax=Bacteroidota TaxID=976 RepID=A0A2P8D1E9_9BACT|nr:zeta toxin family protein [Taibaiella chishuiensis]PSK91038.1 putative ABC-type ATPase [Taibaiella chishuiensis]
MSQPNLYVIAGPNGSGKSTFSRSLTLLDKVIDPDVELNLRRLQFPDISSANLLEAMNDNWFPNMVHEAIEKRKDFAFETNFRSASLMEVVKQFEEAGYLTHLFFIGLPSLQLSIKRVMLRVSKGGHDVDNADIEINYKASLENLEKYGASFDRTWLLHSSEYGKQLTLPYMVCKAEKGQLLKEQIHIPKWAEHFVRTLDRTRLEIEQKQSLSKRRGRRL